MSNIELADDRARQNKHKRWGVIKHDKHKEEHLQQLQKDLLNGTYKTSQYHTFTIYEPKERLIAALPYYPDRIGQHALLSILEPIWVKTFVTCSYACIKGRGIHGAYKGVIKSLKDVSGTQYCLKLDIKKCYASLNHGILKQVIRKKIKDQIVLKVLDEIIDSWAEGIPIGNYLSQFLNNLYFTEFDHYVKEVLKVKHYHRYADDMVFFAATKEDLWNIFYQVKEYIYKLKVDIKHNYRIFPVDTIGVDFVGYVFRHDYVLLRSSIKNKLNCLLSKYLNRTISKKQLKTSLSSYYGWLKYCNSKHYLTVVQEKTNLIYRVWVGDPLKFRDIHHTVKVLIEDKRNKYTLVYCKYNNKSKIIKSCSKNPKENIERLYKPILKPLKAKEDFLLEI